MAKFSLDKVKMNVVRTARNGVVNAETIFIFSQNERFVSANFSGGPIQQGYLVGYFDNDRLFFSYCQLQVNGKIDNGQSVCDLSSDENGKIKLAEHFKWGSKKEEEGVNVFLEL